jgi:hypothetical protein
MMDIFTNSSIDIPYEDTNYIGSLASSGISIKCIKILTKKYEDSTYFKLGLPLGAVITTDDNILLTINRDDFFRFTETVKITNNIIRIKTTEIKWVNPETTKAFDLAKELERISHTQWSVTQTDSPSVLEYNINQQTRFAPGIVRDIIPTL